MNHRSLFYNTWRKHESLLWLWKSLKECGKIFGRMGHPERFTEGLMKNIPDANYHNIFRNGVAYFTS